MKTLQQHVDTLLEKKTTLNLLWWEWTPTYWPLLRNGISGNFITQPPKQLTPNPKMTEEQKKVAAEFVDGLLELGALTPVPPDEELHANGPLQVIPKPGQPGQWRVLSDMHTCRHNDHIASDPVRYPRVLDVLPRLTPG
eukprot:12613022-Ditylum_brightwellii.AAC.1